MLKVLAMANYQLHLEMYWCAHTLHMGNRQNGKSTELRTSDLIIRA